MRYIPIDKLSPPCDDLIVGVFFPEIWDSYTNLNERKRRLPFVFPDTVGIDMVRPNML